MAWDVLVEWQEHLRRGSRAEQRADFRHAVATHNLWMAVHTAASRVIGAVSAMMGGSGEVAFDYDALPSVESFLPRYGGTEDFEEPDEYDERPLDPEKMTEKEWAEMFSDVRRWQRFTSGTGEYARN